MFDDRSVLGEINATLPSNPDIVEDKAQHALCMGELTQVRAAPRRTLVLADVCRL
jgi:hypothetical protein